MQAAVKPLFLKCFCKAIDAVTHVSASAVQLTVPVYGKRHCSVLRSLPDNADEALFVFRLAATNTASERDFLRHLRFFLLCSLFLSSFLFYDFLFCDFLFFVV